MPATPHQRYRVVPAPAGPGALLTDLLSLADCADADNPVTRPDGELMVFPFFGDAARWADEHS